MEIVAAPKPGKEFERILELSEYNLDYDTLSQNFEDLTLLAASFCGTDISLINLLDNYTQWTVAQHGIAIDHMPCEDSVCQFTVAQEVEFEVQDLSADERFTDKDYVAGSPQLKYYYGVPITTSNGHNLGALCVLHKSQHDLTQDKKDLLRIMAREVVNRLNTFKQVETLKQQIKKQSDTKRMLAHDIRGPLSGIIGLSQLGLEEASQGNTTELLDYMRMIQESGKSAIQLLEDILNAELNGNQAPGNTYNLHTLKDKLVDLFTPRSLKKKVNFTVAISQPTAQYNFPKGQLLQIIANLVSNAIKFTAEGGRVAVDLRYVIEQPAPQIFIEVTDTGIGIEQAHINGIMEGTGQSTSGTNGEVGYGLGLTLVKQIVDSMNGTFSINSILNQGTTFSVMLPL